jgi:PucR family transcriptional regulator, purine catabolism regulatory protein
VSMDSGALRYVALKLTLGDLLRQPDLNLTLLTEDRAALTRPVLGAHSIEIAFPSRWVPRDWIMLTTGLRLRGRRDEQRQLIAELHEHGQAALGWGIGLVVQRVPRAVLSEANARGFPVFVVPIEIPFRDVISFVSGARLHDDLYVMRRIMAMQDYLMDALHLDDPESAIIDRLAAMLEADALLFSTDGSLLQRSGRTDPAEVVDALGAGDDALVEAEVHGRQIFGIPVNTEHRRAGWLALVLPQGPLADRLGKPVLRSAAQLLGLVAHARRLEASDERKRRVEVLMASLQEAEGERVIPLEHQARALGLDFSEPARAVAWGRRVDRPPLPAAVLDEVAIAIEDSLAAARLPFLLAPRDDWIAGIVQGGDEAIPHLLPERAREIVLEVGVGRSIRTLGDAAQSMADARVALEHACHNAAAVVRFDDLDPASWLLASCDQDVATQKVVELLNPIRHQAPLLETLRTYFAVNMNVAEAALRLNVHRNTVRYRLARIEELLGMRLDAPRTIANLHLALLTERLEGEGEGPGATANGPDPERPASDLGLVLPS